MARDQRLARWATLPAILAAGPASAHGFAPIPPEVAWRFWSLDPLALGPILLLHVLYGRGLRAWRIRRGGWPQALSAGRVAAFAAGELALVVALLSPVDAVAETILTAHMVQHVLLVAVAPPLLVLGRPGTVCLAGLPVAWRRGLARNPAVRAVLTGWRRLARPVPAATLHGAALWIWHAPGPFEFGRADEWMHRVEHLTFFGTAYLFWGALAEAAAHRRSAAIGAAAALATLVHGGFLAALIGMSPTVLYEGSTRWAPLWGMTPLEDQQLAGAIMWVPAGAAYLLAGLALANRLLAPAPDGGRPSPAFRAAAP